MVAIPEALTSFLNSGLSIQIAARSRALVPTITRAVGLTISPDRTQVTVFVPEAPSSALLADVAEVPLLALTCSEIATHRTVQLKGVVEEVRPAHDDERALLDEYLLRFSAAIAAAGVPRHQSMRITRWPARAVGVRVTDLFEQTPGPGAGAPMTTVASP